jgi:hypothetical protein
LVNGGSLKWLAVAPQKWKAWPDAVGQVREHAARYLVLFALWATLFGFGVSALGYKLSRFAGTIVTLRPLRTAPTTSSGSECERVMRGHGTGAHVSIVLLYCP